MKPILIELDDDTFAKFFEYKLHTLPDDDKIPLLNKLVWAITIGHGVEPDDFKVYKQLKKIRKELKDMMTAVHSEDSDEYTEHLEDLSSKSSILEEEIDLQSKNYTELAAEIQKLKEVAEENGNVLDRCPHCGGKAVFTMVPAISPETGCYTRQYKLKIQCEQCHHSVKRCCEEDEVGEGRQKLFEIWKGQQPMNAQGENDE